MKHTYKTYIKNCFFSAKRVLKHIPLIALLIFIPYSYSKLYSKSQTLQLHVDERIYVNRAQFIDYYLNGDFSNSIWQSYLAYDYPILSGLLFGSAIRLQTQKPAIEYLQERKFLYDEINNNRYLLDEISDVCCSIQALPSTIQTTIEPILIARKASVLFAALSILVFSLIGVLMGGLWLGLLFGVLLYNNPLFQSTMITALGDAPLIFFMLLHFYLVLLFIKHLSKRNDVHFALFTVANITSGLAISTKQNGGISLIFFLSILILLWILKLISLRKAIFLCTLSTAINAVIYLIINPFTWSSPITNTLYMIQYRIDFTRSLQREPGLSSLNLSNFPARISVVLKKAFFPGGWHTNFSQLSTFIPLDVILLSAGIIGILTTLTTHLYVTKERAKNLLPEVMPFVCIMLWIFSLGLSIVLLIPMDFDHYYLPLVVAVCASQGLGIYFGLQPLLRTLRNTFNFAVTLYARIISKHLWIPYGIMGCALLIAIIPKIIHLDDTPLSYDEIYSISLSSQSSFLSLINGVSYDPGNPPLHFVFLKAWMSLFGSGPVVARSLSLVFFSLSVIYLYLLCKKIFTFSVVQTVICLSLYSFNSLIIFYSTVSRTYSLMLFSCIAITYYMFAYLKQERIQNRTLLLFVFIASIGIYSHYGFSIFLVILLVSIILTTFNRKLFPRYVLLSSPLGFGLPLYFWLLSKFTSNNTWYEFYQVFTPWKGISEIFRLLSNNVLDLRYEEIGIGLLVIGATYSLYRMIRNGPSISPVLVILNFAILFILLFSFTPLHEYLSNPKYIIFIYPFLYILAVHYLLKFNTVSLAYWTFFLCLFFVNNSYYSATEHWRELGKILKTLPQEEAAILVQNPVAKLPIQYYYKWSLPILCVKEITDNPQCQGDKNALLEYRYIYFVKNWWKTDSIDDEAWVFYPSYKLISSETNYNPIGLWVFEKQ